MHRSKRPTLKPGLSRLRLYQQRGKPTTEAGQASPRNGRRIAGHYHYHHHTSDFQHRELRLQVVARVTGTGVYDFDFAAGTSYWSPELKAMAGLPQDWGELSLEQMTQIAHPEDSERFMQQVEASLDPQGDGHFEGEYRIMRPDGALRWVRVRGRTFFAGQAHERRVLGASGIVIDITEQKRIEERLRESEERYRTLFNNMTEGFAFGEPILDVQGRPVSYRYLVVNEAFYVQTGIPRGIEGLPIRDYLPQLEQYWIERYCAVALTGKPDRVDAYNADTRRHYDVYVFSPCPGKFAILFRDITEQKQAEEDLRKFKFFSDHSSESNFVMDLKGRLRYVNRRLCERTGYSEEEMLRLHIQDINPNATEALIRDVVERARDGRMVPFESIRRRKDGSTYPVEISATALEVQGEWLIFSVARDITERKRAEEALRENREQLALAFKAGRSGSFEWDPQTDENRWSDELLSLYGLKREEFGGRNEDWIACLHPEDRAAGDAAVQQALQTGEYAMEFRIRRHDTGEIRWMHGRGEVLFDAAGKPRRLIGINVDITERKAAEEQIQALNAELEDRVKERTAQLQESNEALLKSNADLKHFAHATAHDLQTPLRSIAGFTQLLRKEVQGRVNEQVDEWSTAVVENTRRLQVLIQDILSYTRLETLGLPFQMTDLQKVFDEVVSSLSALIGETRAEVTCSALPALAVDRTQIAQVFQNLIENGIKYNLSTPPRVAVAGELQEDQWVFSVADNGIGIDPKHYDRVFELFKRLHPYHQFPGTGIGVPLCRRIVERHGGHMWIESRPGEGSTFYFSLPAERDKGL